MVFAVLLFVAAAAGGFALSRYIGGEPILPPEQTSAPNTGVPSEGGPEELVTRTGNAATITGAQGGGFTLPVPSDWVVFAEEISDPALGNSTRVYYVSPNGTQLLTVERLAGFYPDHELAEYLEKLEAGEPEVTVETLDETAIKGIEPGPVQAPDSALEITYRTIANAKALVPDDPNALDQNRVTFARLLPYAGDLWVVAVTVPIDQEDSGSGLFERIAPNFQVTG
jgi:hypothetical protein